MSTAATKTHGATERSAPARSTTARSTTSTPPSPPAYDPIIPNRRRRIAFLGTRGVPGRYSGFETFVENLGAKLAEDGHLVTVYNRRFFVPTRNRFYRGMRLRHFPSIPSKHFDTMSHTMLSMLHAWFCRYDVVILCGVGNAPFCWVPRLAGTRVIFNVDGSDWKRGKWGKFGRSYLRRCETMAAKWADVLIADAKAVQRNYEEVFGVDSTYIPYGGDMIATSSTSRIREFGLREKEYILFVGRLVPENNAHLLIEAHAKIDTDMPLVIVGDAPYAKDYIAGLHAMADERVIFTGYQFGEAYRELSSHPYAYVLASEVGGTHPVLVEQMSIGNCILAYDTAADREVVEDAGVIFQGRDGADDLSRQLQRLIDDPAEAAALRAKAAERARNHYSWKAVAAAYMRLIETALQK